MAPFTSMLKSKRGRKPRAPSPTNSPGSSQAPRSPTTAHQRLPNQTAGILQTGQPQDDSLDRSGPSTQSTLDPSPSQANDILEQISAFAFPLPPSTVIPRQTASGPSIRFAVQERPRTHYQVSLHLSQEEHLGDMLAMTGLIAPRETPRETSPRPRVSRDLPPLPRTRSATFPQLPEVSQTASAPAAIPNRRAPPRPIVIPDAARTSANATIELIGSSASLRNPLALRSTPSLGDLSSSKGTESSPAPLRPAKPTPESGVASAPSATQRTRAGSSPSSYPSTVPADASGRPRAIDSKPQPSLPLSPPFEVPSDEERETIEEKAAIPSRPPRPTNPHAVKTIDTTVAKLVSSTLARQSTASAATTVYPPGLLSPAPTDVPTSRIVSTLTPDQLPFTPGFLVATEGLSPLADVDQQRMRVDSATLPLEFEAMQTGGPSSSLLVPSPLGRPSPTASSPSSRTGSSPLSSAGPPSAFSMTSQKDRRASKRSASMTELQNLGQKISGLKDGVSSIQDPTERPIQSPSLPQNVPMDVDMEEPKTGVETEFISRDSGKGKMKEVDVVDSPQIVSIQVRRGSRSSNGSTPTPPAIVIPTTRTSGALTPASAAHSPSPGTTPAISTPGTASTSRSVTAVGIGPFSASSIGVSAEGIVVGPSSQPWEDHSQSREPATEKDVMKLTRGLQQLSNLAIAVESRSALDGDVEGMARRGSDPSSDRSSMTLQPSTRNNMPSSAVEPRAVGIARQTSFTKPRPAPTPGPQTSAPSSRSETPIASSVAPLTLRNRANVPAPIAAVQRLQGRERSASDAPPLSPRQNLQRSASISELGSPAIAGASQAPSSFTATLSRVFSNGLNRKRSDRSLKGKDKDKDAEKGQEEFASLDASDPRNIISTPLSGTTTIRSDRRNTPSQFPQTPRPFSITSSADHSHGHGSSTLSPTIAAPVSRPPELNIIPSSLQSTPPATGAPVASSSVAQARTVAAARAAAKSTAALPISGTPRRPRGANVAETSTQGSLNGVPPPKASPLYIPKFESVPVPWKGLTMDAAQWTFTSKELQDIVGRAIRESAEASAIRLLNPDILDTQLPNETYRLELLREDIKARYKFQVRRRRLLMRSLNLYIDGSDPDTAKRLTEELAESMETTDRLSQELFQVTDQLAQMSQLSQRHTSSALSMALKKLNASFIKAKGEAIDYQLQLAMLEAERDEAWATAESIERELDHYKRKHGVATDYEFLASPNPHPPSSWGSRTPSTTRVSAARKTSTRASKASLRMSKRSNRSSASSIRFIGAGPSTGGSSGSGSRHSGSSKKQIPSQPTIPPVPSVLTRSSSRDHSSRSHSRRASWAASPATTSQSMIQAQNQLFEMLGIPHEDITRAGTPSAGEAIRPRSYSAPSSPTSLSSHHSRRNSLPNTVGLLESPQVIAAMLTLPSS